MLSHPSADQFLSRKLPSARRAFTLVEMLVVIGILVILMAILLPVLSRARESAKRVKCAANLHTIGDMAAAFATDHKGVFPVCYRMRNTGSDTFPYRVPFYITQDTHYDSDSSRDGWPQMGNSWQTWAGYAAKAALPPSQVTSQADLSNFYAATLATFSCPSSDKQARFLDLGDPTYNSPEYGAVVAIGYMYVGGLSADSMTVPQGVKGGNQSVGHWNNAPPAMNNSGAPNNQLFYPLGGNTVTNVKIGSAPLSACVLAADIVYWDGLQNGDPKRYLINHPRTNDRTLPDFQNVLYGDGRVEGHGREEYTDPLNDDSIPALQTVWNWSMKLASGRPGYFYWGEAEARPTVGNPATDSAPATSYGGGGWGPPPPWLVGQPRPYAPPLPQPPSEGTPGSIPTN